MERGAWWGVEKGFELRSRRLGSGSRVHTMRIANSNLQKSKRVCSKFIPVLV
jgi:hypothetical protein